jgi:hypothetical protein
MDTTSDSINKTGAVGNCDQTPNNTAAPLLAAHNGGKYPMNARIESFAISSVLGSFAVGLAIATSTLTASAAGVNLFDSTFGNVTFDKWGLNVNVTDGVSNNGNPNAVFGDFSFLAGATTNAGVAVVDGNMSYTPGTQGAITSLFWSAEKDIVGPSPAASSDRLLLFQNGAYYVYVSPTTAYSKPPGGYQLFNSADLTAGNFQQICVVGCGNGHFGTNIASGAGNDPSGQAIVALNFLNGGVIDFGVLFIGSPVSPPDETKAYYDNLDVAINTPLPAALPLFASGLGAMGLFGWRRKRKAAAIAG